MILKVSLIFSKWSTEGDPGGVKNIQNTVHMIYGQPHRRKKIDIRKFTVHIVPNSLLRHVYFSIENWPIEASFSKCVCILCYEATKESFFKY